MRTSGGTQPACGPSPALPHLLQTVQRHIADVCLELLMAGLALHMLSERIRDREWLNILRAAYPEERGLRTRDVLLSYFSGAELGSLLPARGGYVVKIAVLHRRLREPALPRLLRRSSPETLTEFCPGAGLLVWAAVSRHLPVRFLQNYLTALGLPAAALALIVAALAFAVRALDRRRARLPRLAEDVAIVRRLTALLGEWRARGSSPGPSTGAGWGACSVHSDSAPASTQR